jgi:hypothetical protein
MTTTAIILPAGVNSPAVVSEVKEKLVELQKIAKETAITDADSLNFVIESGSVAAKLMKSLESEREKIVDPRNKELRSINAFFKQFSEPLDAIKNALSRKVTAYRQEEARKAEEERRRMQEILDAQRAKEIEEAAQSRTVAPALSIEVQARAVDNTIASDTGKSSGRKRWTFKIVDISKVPSAYMVLDSRLVNDAIRNGAREIPGLEIYQEESTTFA